MICGSAPIRAVSSWMPASMSCGIAVKIPVTMLVMICGRAATMASMIVGSAVTMLVSSWMPASMIMGIAAMMKSTSA